MRAAAEWERKIAERLGARHTAGDGGVDLVLADGTAIEVKKTLHSARDLHAAAAQLAMWLQHATGVRHALLVTQFPLSALQN